MKILRSVVCVAGLAAASCHDHMSQHASSYGVLFAADTAAQVAGDWKLSVDTPHGQMPGKLQLKQDGGKLSGTCDIEHMGSMPLAGQIDGKKISFTITMSPSQQFTFMGAVNGEKMGGATDPEGGNWSATRIAEAR